MEKHAHQMHQITIASILGIVIIACALLLGYIYGYNTRVSENAPVGITLPEEINPTSTPISEMPVACTMDAKQCPDGSFVGRSGPKCEFAPCPGEN